MPREIRFPPARSLTVLVALVGLTAVLFAVVSVPAQAAKPCWERVLDEWSDTGKIEGDYSAGCIDAARRHVPEDIRAYTDIIDKLDSYRQTTGRTLQSAGGTGTGPQSGTGTATRRGNEPEPSVNGKDEGPISVVLGSGTTDASSIPVPLVVLAGLALALMAAGAAGFTHRKLKARRISSGE